MKAHWQVTTLTVLEKLYIASVIKLTRKKCKFRSQGSQSLQKTKAQRIIQLSYS